MPGALQEQMPPQMMALKDERTNQRGTSLGFLEGVSIMLDPRWKPVSTITYETPEQTNGLL